MGAGSALTAQPQTLAARVAGLETKLDVPPTTPGNSSLPPSRGQRPNRPEKRLEPGTPFGVGIVALAMYLRSVHAISHQRLSRLLLELFGLAIPLDALASGSEGALDAAFRRGKPAFDPYPSGE